MPRSPFDTEPELTYWSELKKLRIEEGLTPPRVEKICRKICRSEAIAARWRDSPALRFQVAYDFLVEWIGELTGDTGFFVRCAYNLEPDLPVQERSTLGARRRFAARTRQVEFDTVRSREGKAIADFIRTLGVTTQFDSDRPIVEICHPGERWQRVDVPILERPTTLRKRIHIQRERTVWRFDRRPSLVEQRFEKCIVANDNDVGLTGDFLYWDWSDLTVHRLRLEMLSATRFDRLGWIGNLLLVDYRIAPSLKTGQEHVVKYTVEIEGEGRGDTVFEYGHQEPVGDLAVRIEFDPTRLPARCWWYEDLPFAATPGPALPSQLLHPSPAQPYAEKSFGPKEREPYGSGIAWEWS